jgi:UPF0042 nucleotide-binding protein
MPTTIEGRRFIVITGQSGAGKSVALNALEDLGFYCMDNLPAGMLEPLQERIAAGADGLPEQVAVGIDARNPESALAELPARVTKLRARGVPAEVVFLHAAEDVLMRRFSETRRRHPLSPARPALSEAIAAERRLLEPLSEIADLRLDTSRSTVHELRRMIQERVARRPPAVSSIQIMSFGYKFGIPLDADFVFDVRCLPNPYWVTELRDLPGTDARVAGFLRQQPDVAAMIEDQLLFLRRWLPRFEAERRGYLSVALGCTGGRHRSVYMAEELARRLEADGRRVLLTHRDLA